MTNYKPKYHTNTTTKTKAILINKFLSLSPFLFSSPPPPLQQSISQRLQSTHTHARTHARTHTHTYRCARTHAQDILINTCRVSCSRTVLMPPDLSVQVSRHPTHVGRRLSIRSHLLFLPTSSGLTLCHCDPASTFVSQSKPTPDRRFRPGRHRPHWEYIPSMR